MEIQRDSAVTTLKELLVIITGLTITNGFVVLVAGGHYEEIKKVWELSCIPSLLFAGLVLNAVRFYLGNVRLLDDCYLVSFAGIPSEGTDRKKNLPLDYTVVLVTGVLLALLSFYLRDIHSYFTLFAVILAIDIIWFLLTWKDSRDPKIRRQRKWWTINNVGHILPIGYGLSVFNPENSLLWLIPCVAVFTNTIVDFAISWKFYFFTTPSIGRIQPKIFLAAPFTQTMDHASGKVQNQFKEDLQSVYLALKNKGYEIFSAHVREKWGDALEDPATALVRDLSELRESDVVVAFIGSPPSPGVQMELGSAITMNKPILYLVREGDTAPYLLDGIPITTRGLRVTYKTFGDATKQLIQLLENLKANKWMEPTV